MEKVLTPKIEALTAYANGITGKSDTTLSDAVASLADGYGQGGGISDGCEITAIDANGFPTAVNHYGTTVHRQQYWNASSTNGCWRNLAFITFKDVVTIIRDYAFVSCQELALPDLSHVTDVGNYAFQYCKGFAVLSAPELTALKSHVFHGCTNLKTVNLPKCTDCDSQRAFTGCTSLETVQLGSVGYTVTKINSSTFYPLTQSTLTITVYTDGSHVDSLLAGIKSSGAAVNATVIFKASETTTYNGTSYQAGDTITV